MPPKKKSNKDDNDILTRIAIVNADRSVVVGKQYACIQRVYSSLSSIITGVSRRNADKNARKVVLL